MAKQTNGGEREIRTFITMLSLKGKPALNIIYVVYDFRIVRKLSQYLQTHTHTHTAVSVTKQQQDFKP